MDGGEYAAALRVKTEAAVVIAYFADDTAHHLLQVYVGRALDFAGEHHLAGGDEGLACHFGLRVAGKEFVENSVADLVGDFVGMSLRYAFRSEKIMHIHCVLEVSQSEAGHKKTAARRGCCAVYADGRILFARLGIAVLAFFEEVASSQIFPL